MINFEADQFFDITATLVAVTDNQIWLSAEATGGGVTDSIIINWGSGNRQHTIDALISAFGVHVGGPIRMKGIKNYKTDRIDWCCVGCK